MLCGAYVLEEVDHQVEAAGDREVLDGRIGGNRIPTDAMYLSCKVHLSGYEAKFIGLADEISRALRGFIVGPLVDSLNACGKPLKNARVLVLSVAYRRGVGDVRESPALEIFEALAGKGAHVRYADPVIPSLAAGERMLEAFAITPKLLHWSEPP